MNEEDKKALIGWLQNVLQWEGKNGKRKATGYGGGCPMNVPARDLLNQFRPNWGNVADRILNTKEGHGLPIKSTFLKDLVDLINEYGPGCMVYDGWQGAYLVFCNSAYIDPLTTEAAAIKASWLEYLQAGTDVTPLPKKPGTFRIKTPVIGRFNDFIGFYATANADGYLLEDDGMAWWNMTLSKKPESLPAIIRHINACALNYGVQLNGAEALPEDPELVKGVKVSRQVTADKLGAGIQKMLGILTEINLC